MTFEESAFVKTATYNGMAEQQDGKMNSQIYLL